MIYINIKKVTFLVVIILAASYFISIQDNNLNKIEIKIISYNIHSGTDRNMIPTLFDTINFLKKSYMLVKYYLLTQMHVLKMIEVYG